MRTSLLLSLGLHAAVLAGGIVAWPSVRVPPLPPEPPGLEIAFVEIGERDEAPPPVPEIEEPEPEPEPEPDEPEPLPEDPEPETPTVPEEVADASEDAVPLPDAETDDEPTPPRPLATPQQKPKPPKRLSLDRVASLIDRSKKEEPEPRKATTEDFREAIKRRKQEQAAPRTTGIDGERLRARLAGVIGAQVARCWSPPIGIKGFREFRAVITMTMNEEGGLIGTPILSARDAARARRGGEEAFRTYAESALRAVQRCAPYDLPTESYHEWRETRLVFDPQEIVN
ncbi:MAG: hypothetical protein AAGF15_01790 [Pseudomonadota bacterium]